MERVISFVGIFAFIGFCYLISTNRKAIKWKPVIGGCFLQFIFALLILKTPMGYYAFEKAKQAFDAIMGFSLEGSKFIFGPLVDVPLSANVFGPGQGWIFAFQVPGTIILVSSLMAVLYHWGVMQKIVKAFALVMQKMMGTSGSESLATAANVFTGQTEAPLVIRPYLEGMTRSELMAMMTGGFATVAGGVLAAYVGFGIDAGHLLAASVMSAPATLAIAKIIVPETQTSETASTCELHHEKTATNALDAACKGATEGVMLSINVMAMCVAFIALVALLNGTLSLVTAPFLKVPLTFQNVLGVVFSPFAFFMGVPTQDVMQVGSMLGIKTTLNELVAYLELVRLKETLEPRSVTIATYALCGFANFSSIAIQVGGVGSMVPKIRKNLASLGFRAMIGGTMAGFMTAAIAGLLI